MDPDKNLKEQRRLKALIKAGLADADDKARLRELKASYKEWRSRGGSAGAAPRKPRKIRLGARVAKKIGARLGAVKRRVTGVKTTRKPAAARKRKAAPAVSPSEMFTLTREYIDRDGYGRDSGKYFGVRGAPVYAYENDDYSKHGHVRAYDRTAAKAKIRKEHGMPRAKFHR
jgi:hypothetical protein